MIKFMGSLFAKLVTVSALLSSTQGWATICTMVYSNETASPVSFIIIDDTEQQRKFTIGAYDADWAYVAADALETCEQASVEVYFDYLYAPGIQQAHITLSLLKTLVFVPWYKEGFTGPGDPIGVYVNNRFRAQPALLKGY